MFSDVIAIAALGIWVYLLTARGGFWLCRERDEPVPPPPARWPGVVAIIPARNEATCIADSIGSLARQDYPGALSIIVVDDDSDDDTAAIARQAAARLAAHRPFTLIESRHLPSGWTGKLWALKQGVDGARELRLPSDYLLLTDADIVHNEDSVRALVARAETEHHVLTSLMAKLRCESLAECSHVPAFVFFFQMLYPFAWVNSAHHATAAAAGGCMLVQAEALRRAGGIESIRGALIDDCALANKMKAVGSIWLGLSGRVRSIRRYDRFRDVSRMISRSAYAQLRFSPLLLAGTVLGLTVAFLAAPALALFGIGTARLVGVLTWALMALAVQPMLRFYRVSPLWGPALAAIALAYMLYTLDSAYRYARGQGGRWKGRIQANASTP
jgi:hopene-associated glycosyltransferase HpnB